ncbi:MAG: hypothetical protein PHS65_04035 [Arcobacteraceae bacterium]|nr:hypothetical protein [Arcobacteraceae bacterium]
MIAVVVDVLEVLSIKESSRLVNGVTINERRAELRTDFGILRVKVAPSIIMNEGFNGRAWLSVKPYETTINYQSNSFLKKTLDLVEIIHYNQGEKVKNDYSQLWK